MLKDWPFRGLIPAGAVLAGSLAATLSAQANWACEVALCMTNPAGPMAVSECIPPITRLYEHLAEGGSFPLCQSADGHVNFTRYGVERFELCPAGSRTTYRSAENGSGSKRYCKAFVPGEAAGSRWDDDNGVVETRVIDGKRVTGEVVEREAPRRSKPRFLEYVVEGETRRIWW